MPAAAPQAPWLRKRLASASGSAVSRHPPCFDARPCREAGAAVSGREAALRAAPRRLRRSAVSRRVKAARLARVSRPRSGSRHLQSTCNVVVEHSRSFAADPSSEGGGGGGTDKGHFGHSPDGDGVLKGVCQQRLGVVAACPPKRLVIACNTTYQVNHI